jgi:hypothetical protein
MHLRKRQVAQAVSEEQRALWAHLGRRRVMPVPTDEEAADAVAEFLAGGGAVTVCPAAYAAPIHNGEGIKPPPPTKPQKRISARVRRSLS